MWLIKYVSPALVIACSQPSGSGPSCPIAFVDLVIAGLTARVKKMEETKNERKNKIGYKMHSRRVRHAHRLRYFEIR